jgi:hypothetical protein
MDSRFLIAATVTAVAGSVGIAAFQLALLAECGVIHRRIRTLRGQRPVDDESGQNAAQWVGKASPLESRTNALFVSFSCSDCGALLRALDESLTTHLTVFVVDRDQQTDVNELLRRFGYSFGAVPGKALFDSLKVNWVPLLVQTDASRHVRRMRQVAAADELATLCADLE